MFPRAALLTAAAVARTTAERTCATTPQPTPGPLRPIVGAPAMGAAAKAST